MIKLLKEANGNLPRTEKEKQKMINTAAKHYAKFLTALGFDYTQDENSKDTPRRVAKAWVEDLISGCVNDAPKITTFPNRDKYPGLVMQSDIPVISLCSHHNLAFTGYAHIAYVPSVDGKVIGLSKLNRIVEHFARRPQLQEALTMQIHDYLNETMEGNLGVGIILECRHSCCSHRGIGHDSVMRTAHLTGCFYDDEKSRNEFYNLLERCKKA